MFKNFYFIDIHFSPYTHPDYRPEAFFKSGFQIPPNIEFTSMGFKIKLPAKVSNNLFGKKGALLSCLQEDSQLIRVCNSNVKKIRDLKSFSPFGAGLQIPPSIRKDKEILFDKMEQARGVVCKKWQKQSSSRQPS